MGGEDRKMGCAAKSRRSKRARTPLFLLLSVLATLILVAGRARAQAARLQFAEKPTLLDCALPSSRPCFRFKLNIVDDGGNPVTRTLPEAQQLANNITVFVDGERVTPFYAATPGERTVAQRRIALILIDVSGSMNKLVANRQTRFAAAKAAASRFLYNFEDGVDRVAIVPFESHEVLETVRNATFAGSSNEAWQQIERLPIPAPKNNTALYSAVNAGLEVVNAQARDTSGSVDATLIVLTDGKNDVGHPGDDPGLLGSAGLEKVQKTVAATPNVQVIAISFGNTGDGEMDEGALKAITPRYYQASDSEGLSDVFHSARVLQTSRIQVTFQSPARDRASLAGRSFNLRAALLLPSGVTIESETLTWSPPTMGLVSYNDTCGPQEKKALEEALLLGDGREPSPWISVLRPLLVFVGLGTTLLILWFGVPRLVWRDQYLGEFQAAPPVGRWAGPAQEAAPPGPVERPSATPRAEDGWGRGGAPPRTPADATRVLPVNLTAARSGTRTRLDKQLLPDD
jgi:hypothetical protein